MTEQDIEIAATIGAMKAVIMAILGTQAAQVGGENVEVRRAYITGLRDLVMTGWNTGKMDENNPELQAILQRVPVHIRAMFENLDVG